MQNNLFLSLIVICVSTLGFSQMQYGGTLQTNSDTLYISSGTITDHAGTGATGVYGTNRDDRLTICPRRFGDVVRLDFTALDIKTANGAQARDCQDWLYMGQGAISYTGGFDDIYCGELIGAELPIVVSTAADGCITLRFQSNNSQQLAGFAITVSNVTPCKNPRANILNSGVPYNVCPSTANNPTVQPLSFSGAPSLAACTQDYSTNVADNIVDNRVERLQNITALAGSCYHNDPQTTPLHSVQASGYDWNWGDNSVSNSSGAVATHSFSSPGIYSVTLKVRDDNTDILPGGCPSGNEARRIVNVVPPPTRTSPVLNLVCSNVLNTAAGSQTGTLVATATTDLKAEILPTISTTPTVLPDGTGASYTNSVNYGGYFSTGVSMSSACYPTVILGLEHSWGGDLWIDLVAPNGQFVRLFNRQLSSIKFGLCSNTSNTDGGGCPANYTFLPSGGTAFANLAANVQAPPANGACSYTGACEAGSYWRSSISWASFQAFTVLDGAPLNGSWSIRVTDNQSLDNGILSSWSIVFPPACFKALNEISPIQSTLVWSNGNTSTSTAASTPAPGDPCPSGAPCTGNVRTGTSSTIGPYATGGPRNFTYTVTDEFGCLWPGTGTVNVACILPVSLTSFTANQVNTTVELDWTVETEIENDYYTLLKSTNGIDYREFARIDSKVNGNTSNTVLYDAIDIDPYEGVSYYQLQQTDFNGSVNIIDEVVVNMEGTISLVNIQPNPVNEELDLTFASIKNNQAIFEIMDMSGKVLLRESRTLLKGNNSIKLDVQHLKSGIYIVNIKTKEEITNNKFIKN